MKKKIGVIGVDAGLCWVGDPCYVLHKDQPYPEIGTSWDEFCDIIHDEEPTIDRGYKQFGKCLGVCARTGYGDGLYPVYADIDDGVVKSLTVEFVSENNSELD